MEEESDQSDLTACLEKALHRHTIENPKLNQTISSLIRRSVEYGRANRVLGENPHDDACREYVEKIITYQKKYHNLIACLDRGDLEVWTKTIKNIRKWANGYLIRQNIHGPLKKKIVEESVPNAVMAYLSGTYLYDTNFDAWFCVLVQNVCRKYIKEQLHPNHKNHNAAVSYDKYEFLLEALADNNEIASQRTRELRSDLLEAVEKLSSQARQELIILHYFEGYSFKEIAKKMERSLNAVYKLHFDALNELRTYFDTHD